MTPVETVLAGLVILSAIAALLLSLGVVTAYFRLIWRENGVVFYFALAQVLMFGGAVLRISYWSWVTADPAIEAWPSTGMSLGMALLMNLLVIGGNVCALQATYLMIEDPCERRLWTWYTSPLYPVDNLPWLVRVLLEHLMRRRRRRERR